MKWTVTHPTYFWQ